MRTLRYKKMEFYDIGVKNNKRFIKIQYLSIFHLDIIDEYKLTIIADHRIKNIVNILENVISYLTTDFKLDKNKILVIYKGQKYEKWNRKMIQHSERSVKDFTIGTLSSDSKYIILHSGRFKSFKTDLHDQLKNINNTVIGIFYCLDGYETLSRYTEDFSECPSVLFVRTTHCVYSYQSYIKIIQLQTAEFVHRILYKIFEINNIRYVIKILQSYSLLSKNLSIKKNKIYKIDKSGYFITERDVEDFWINGVRYKIKFNQNIFQEESQKIRQICY